MRVDMLVSYDEWKKKTDKEVMNILKDEYPERDLYSMSLGWRESSEYILKAKGVEGDIIVAWS